MSEPWYVDGLRFSCQRCGGCCGGEPGHVFLRRGEASLIALFLGLEEKGFRRRFSRKIGARTSLIEEEDGRCVFLTPRGCRIYRVRPQQCRAFPFWRRNLARRESWEEAARGCPGMGQGRLFTRGEIESRIVGRGR